MISPRFAGVRPQLTDRKAPHHLRHRCIRWRRDLDSFPLLNNPAIQRINLPPTLTNHVLQEARTASAESLSPGNQLSIELLGIPSIGNIHESLSVNPPHAINLMTVRASYFNHLSRNPNT